MTDPSLYVYSLEDFKEEAKGLLGRAEDIITDIGNHPGDKEKVNALFRVVHSLKGSAAYAGLTNVNSFSHLYESFLGDMRNNKYGINQDILNILIRARDYLDDLIFQPETVETVIIDENIENPLQQLTMILKVKSSANPSNSSLPKGEKGGVKEGKLKSSTGQQKITISTQDPTSMDQKDVIKITITNSVKSLYSFLKDISPDKNQIAKTLTKLEESLLWAFSDEAAAAMKHILEMKELVSSNLGTEELSRLRKEFNLMAAAIKEQLTSLDTPRKEKEAIRIEEKWIDKKKAQEIRGASKDEIVRMTSNRYLDALYSFLNEDSPNPEQMKRTINRLKELNRWAFNKDKRVNGALSSMEDLLRKPYAKVSAEITTKYSALRSLLTTLLEEKGGGEEGLSGIGQPITSQEVLDLTTDISQSGIEGRGYRKEAAMSTQARPPSSLSTLKVKTKDVEALTSTISDLAGVDHKDIERLQAHLLNLRMIPVGEIFSRFRKIVRDLSEEMGKDIEIEISGESVKLDKLIADKLSEPLLHMIRNAASHGLETPAERRTVGKKPIGLIKLDAYQEGGHVIIEVSDDGRGISPEKIRKRGVELGLLKPVEEKSISEKALLDLIFAPGFSTKEGADKVSGRGVGMDVVRDAVTSVQGTISIETKEGVGTTFRLQLPLTLAVIRAMILELSNYKVAVPSASVDRALPITEEELRKKSFVDNERLYLNLPDEGEVIPVINLSNLFSVGNQNKKRCVVLVKTGIGQKAALVVDSALKREPLMVKPLDRFAENRYFSSASFLGNDIILLLNTPSLTAA